MTDPAYLTTKELAALLRVKERKVYEMVGAGAIPHRRVTGKLLFPREEVEAWLNGGEAAPVQAHFAAAQAVPQIVVGSHDPLLEWALRESESGLAALFDGRLDGMERVADGEATAACIHAYDPDTDEWNVPQVKKTMGDRPVVLLTFAKRSRGLLVPPGNPEHIQTVRDLAGRRVALRQPRAGGRVLFTHLLTKAGLTFDDLSVTEISPQTEAGAALAVSSGQVDAGIGLESLARQYQLGFLPIMEERYDLLVYRPTFFEPPMQRLFAFFRTAGFSDHAARLSGYDLSEIGAVRFNGA